MQAHCDRGQRVSEPRWVDRVQAGDGGGEEGGKGVGKGGRKKVSHAATPSPDVESTHKGRFPMALWEDPQAPPAPETYSSSLNTRVSDPSPDPPFFFFPTPLVAGDGSRGVASPASAGADASTEAVERTGVTSSSMVGGAGGLQWWPATKGGCGGGGGAEARTRRRLCGRPVGRSPKLAPPPPVGCSACSKPYKGPDTNHHLAGVYSSAVIGGRHDLETGNGAGI